MGSPSSYEGSSADSANNARTRSRGSSQLKFVTALTRHSRLSTAEDVSNTSAAGRDATSDQSKITMTKDMARWNKPRRQGPFLMQPAPLELEGEIESNACDLVYMSSSMEDQAEEDSEMGMFLMSYSDGKIDVCLEVEKIEGRWVTQVSRLP